jgi:hypothetical protein
VNDRPAAQVSYRPSRKKNEDGQLGKFNQTLQKSSDIYGFYDTGVSISKKSFNFAIHDFLQIPRRPVFRLSFFLLYQLYHFHSLAPEYRLLHIHFSIFMHWFNIMGGLVGFEDDLLIVFCFPVLVGVVY